MPGDTGQPQPEANEDVLNMVPVPRGVPDAWSRIQA